MHITHQPKCITITIDVVARCSTARICTIATRAL